MGEASLAESMSLGRIAYNLWYRPVSRLKVMLREGGPLEQRRTAEGRVAMMEAAAHLPALLQTSGIPLELHLLTGARFWDQSIFCLWTFARQSGRTIRPMIYDDGTLTDADCEKFTRLFPETQFYKQSTILDRLETALAKFPTLQKLRLNYPNIRKLTDVHIGSSGWKLVIDSDLLFFHNPALLVEWLDAPRQPLHAVDIETSYGYSPDLLNSLAGATLAERVNVGLTGLNSDDLDWEKIESWCRTLLEREGMHYYLEQAVIAMLVAEKSCTVAPAANYITLPRPPEAMECNAVMHHYVAESKRWYFQRNWRHAMAASAL
ncbi:MAG: glycosyl transferase [Chthoniobacterales bacterium]